MATETEVAAASSESPEEPRLPLVELDRALIPLRHLLAYALSSEPRLHAVQYVEANAGRWLRAALALDLPQAVRDVLATAAGDLLEIDSLDVEAQRQRLGNVYQTLSRVDAMLGLPLPARAHRFRAYDKDVLVDEAGEGESVDDDETASTDEEGRSDGRRGGGRRSRRGRGRKTSGRGRRERPQPVPEAPPQPAVTQRHLSDSRGGGRSLSEVVGAPAEVLAAFDAAGVSTVADALLLRPAGEEVLAIHGAGLRTEAGRAAIGGRVKARWTRLRADGTRASEATLVGAAPLAVRWEGGAPDWLLEQLAPGERVVLVGEVVIEDDLPVLIDPELAADDGKHSARLVAYAVPDVTPEQQRAVMRQVVPLAAEAKDPYPAAWLKDLGLPALADALQAVHEKGGGARDAARRLAFDEALMSSLALLWPRYRNGRERGVPHGVLHGMTSRLCQQFDIWPTDEQVDALEDIKRDLRRPNPMQRVLLGDVGAGRGLVGTLAAVMVAQSKGQVLFALPDSHSAEVRHAFAEPVLRELGLVSRALPAEPSKAQRDALRRGEVHIVYAPLGILEQDVEFRRLGLVIAEEREDYGAVPPMVLDIRPPRPDALIVPALPVPRSALMAAYPDYDVTVLTDSQASVVPGRVFSADHRADAYARARAVVESGAQAIVVFPMVKGRDLVDRREASRLVSALEAEFFEGLRVVLLHGEMARDERVRVFDDFRHHRADVLVSTAVFEDGPSIPRAAAVIVEQADRMSHARLYRVRGFVSGSRSDAECLYVLGDVPDEEGAKRVEALTHPETDGFELGRAALAEQGYEGLLADEEGSPPTFAWLDPDRDEDLVEAAQRLARSLLDQDATLRRGNNPEIAKLLQVFWPRLVDSPAAVHAGGARRRRRRRKRS